MTPRAFCVAAAAVLSLSLAAANAQPAVTSTPTPERQLFERAAPTVVAVRYIVQAELSRTERVCCGVIVSTDGRVMIPLAAVDDRVPNDQLRDFKILRPGPRSSLEEIDAEFVGRDLRSDVAFVRARKPQSWPAIQFVDAPPAVGDALYSVGILPISQGCRPYLMRAMIAGAVPGEFNRFVIGDGGLASTGSPVFNAEGAAIGFVNFQPPFPLYLNAKDALMAVISPPKFMTPTSEFAQSLSDPPSPGAPLPLAWIGLPDLEVVSKDDALYLGVAGIPALRVSTVSPGSPAAAAGLHRDELIVGLNGRPLDTGGDLPQTSDVFFRQLLRLKPGTRITLSLKGASSAPLREVELTLGTQPKPLSAARRFWAPDLGLGVRELVAVDAYNLKQSQDFKGVIVTAIRPGSPAADAKLKAGDVLLTANGERCGDADIFKSVYEQFRQKTPNAPFVLTFQRGDQEQTATCPPVK